VIFGQFLLKIEKNENFQNWPKLTKYDFLWSKMTLSGIIFTKTSKSPGILTNTNLFYY